MSVPVRYFRLVCTPEEQQYVDGMLAAEGFAALQEPVFSLARRLSEGPYALGRCVAARFGRVYIQDKSSMVPPLCLAPEPGDTVLDLCASPGSKTGLLAQLVGPQGVVLANEPNTSRLETLRANMRHLALPNVLTVSERGEDLPLAPETFSHILVDAPCSGWGTAAKNPNVRQVWHDGNVHGLVELQRNLLHRAAHLAVPGGRIVYSTCTTNPRENEEQIAWAVEHLDLVVDPLSPLPSVSCAPQGLKQGVLQVQEEASESQGFFVALLRKKTAGQHSFQETAAWSELAPKGEEVTAEVLRHLPSESAEHLRYGRVFAFGEKLIYASDKARSVLAPGLRWQGAYVGRRKKGGILLDPRARWLLPAAPGPLGVDVDTLAPLEALLRGQRLPHAEGGKRVGLYWRGLPLGWGTVKGRQVLWAER